MSLSGKTVVFTGTLSMSRAEASSAAKAAGAKVEVCSQNRSRKQGLGFRV